jgi:hypothetical protein
LAGLFRCDASGERGHNEHRRYSGDGNYLSHPAIMSRSSELGKGRSQKAKGRSQERAGAPTFSTVLPSLQHASVNSVRTGAQHPVFLASFAPSRWTVGR